MILYLCDDSSSFPLGKYNLEIFSRKVEFMFPPLCPEKVHPVDIKYITNIFVMGLRVNSSLKLKMELSVVQECMHSATTVHLGKARLLVWDSLR